MKKVKYFYNKHTLRYEKIEVTLAKRLLRSLGFVSTSLIMAIAIVSVLYVYVDSPKEKQLKREISKLRYEYERMESKIGQMDEVLVGLQDRDDNIYRVIFEAEPIASSVREAGTGGSYKYDELEDYENSEMMVSVARRMDKLSKKLYIQSKSYDDLFALIKDKEELLAATPAIQPIANKDLTRFASGYGYRIHPIYKTRKMHYGVDFTAPIGTQIYCTGDGVVTEVSYGKRGFGNHVIVRHGFGYETLYGHMKSVDVREGQKVKRGDVLGYVGNTGTSTGPHLHYEVMKNGRRIDPINFFYNDLSPEEYDRMIEISARHNQSFD